LTGLQDEKMIINKSGTGCFVATYIQLMAGFGVLLFFKKVQKNEGKLYNHPVILSKKRA
jgi:hypothetical protein